jgi:alanyl-tRNA synthetase
MLSGSNAYDFLTSAYKSYASVSEILKTTIEDVPKRLTSFLEDYEELTSKVSKYKNSELKSLTEAIVNGTETIKDKKVYVGQVSLGSNSELKDLALQCLATNKVDTIILLSKLGDKTGIVGAVAKNIQIDISKIIGEVSKLYGGGASKDPSLSIGGGPSEYDNDSAISYIENALLEIF